MQNKKILIIGGTGSLGRELIKRYQADNSIIIFSRDEQKQAALKKEAWTSDLRYVIGDLKDKSSLERTINRYRPDVIINTAAVKHIDICEENPIESINVNIQGHINLMDVLRTLEPNRLPEALIFISTDKACKPVNIYGMCKAISEKLYMDFSRETTMKVCIVRYGNVLNSNGSIIPVFQKLLKEGTDYLPITDPRMTRFFISLEEAVTLIDWAYKEPGSSGKIAVPKLKSFKIWDLASILAEEELAFNIVKLKVVGIRPGEKMHEDLISASEWLCTEEKENYLIGRNPIEGKAYKSYSSNDDVASQVELEEMLKKEGIIW